MGKLLPHGPVLLRADLTGLKAIFKICPSMSLTRGPVSLASLAGSAPSWQLFGRIAKGPTDLLRTSSVTSEWELTYLLGSVVSAPIIDGPGVDVFEALDDLLWLDLDSEDLLVPLVTFRDSFMDRGVAFWGRVLAIIVT